MQPTITAAWRRAKTCESNGCAEVYLSPLGGALIRSTQRSDELVTLTDVEWTDFRDGIKRGDFD